LLAACQVDQDLKSRIAPYFHLLRTDSWGYPLVYPKGTFMVASGSDRRETGTHYTPKSFTESIVKTTLEPIVYDGPSQGAEGKDWKLKTPSELLDLKICDPAMGSGAFLVQVCRYLGERLVEAWNDAEAAGNAVSAEGEVSEHIGSSEPMTTNPDERQTTARRLIAERCLYGVDMNPLAVELAKLSLWLVTLTTPKCWRMCFGSDRFNCCGDVMPSARIRAARRPAMPQRSVSSMRARAASCSASVASRRTPLNGQLRSHRCSITLRAACRAVPVGTHARKKHRNYCSR
jgi:N-6 DNA Methylase